MREQTAGYVRIWVNKALQVNFELAIEKWRLAAGDLPVIVVFFPLSKLFSEIYKQTRRRKI